MNVLDLFSGIGGFSLGLEQAGMRTIGFCEVEPWCRAVLQRHWPDIPIHADIRRLDGHAYAGTVDLVCGGYPCQPFSCAGLRRGAADQRHLWPEMLRVIRGVRPRWVVAENVAGHIKLGFDEVAASLEAENFTVWPFIICASAVGAWHRRERVWIIANANGQRLQGSIEQLPADQGGEDQLPPVLPAFSSPAELCDQLSASALCGKPDGIPHRSYRIRGVGNAIVPKIAEIIGRTIVKFEQTVN